MNAIYSNIHKELVIAAILSIIGSLLLEYGDNNKPTYEYTVSGTVINKHIDESRQCSNPNHDHREYQMTIKPYDLNTYKIYEVNTTKDTYYSHNIGSSIAFKMSAHKVLNHSPSKWKECFEVDFPITAGISCYIITIICLCIYFF